jgi:hypothetical protein
VRKFHVRLERKLLSYGSLRAFYKHVNCKLHALQRVAPVYSNNELVTNDSDKAQAFNDYFASVFTVPTVPTANCNGYVNVVSPDVCFSQTETYKALLSAKRSFSAGPDSIPSAFWANLASVLALPMSVLFSLSHNFGVIPGE